jgi:hypothetical protein
MKQIDLDDLPPRVAQILAGLAAGEALLLVQNGLIMGRLTSVGAEPVAGADPAGEARAAEIFEHFRSLMEDDF